MLLSDVHAHIDLLGNDVEIAFAVKRAENAGVRVIINNSVDPKSIRKTLELSQQHRIVKAALGLYPTEAARLSQAAIEGELGFVKSCKDKIVALGEIGLDYQEAKTERERLLQQQLFNRQVELAIGLGKPVIVHSRQAEKDVVEALIKLGCRKAILHAFHGSLKLAEKAVASGYYITIPTNLGRSSHFQAFVRQLPLSHLLTETDSPYLAIKREGTSEPAHVTVTIEKIAALKGLTSEDTANALFGNYQRLFA